MHSESLRWYTAASCPASNVADYYFAHRNRLLG
jgi:hypothetical protein